MSGSKASSMIPVLSLLKSSRTFDNPALFSRSHAPGEVSELVLSAYLKDKRVPSDQINSYGKI